MDADLVVDFRKETTSNDMVTVVATDPLTDNEEWMIMRPGELIILADGSVVSSSKSVTHKSKSSPRQPGVGANRVG